MLEEHAAIAVYIIAQPKASAELISVGAGGDSELDQLLGSMGKLFRHQDVESWARSGMEEEIIVRCSKAGGVRCCTVPRKTGNRMGVKQGS